MSLGWGAPAERLARNVSVDANGCHVWSAYKRDGYGRLRVRGQDVSAHRLAYELAKGPVPEGMELDHLCRNRACCNPDHLEPVTHRENMLRGGGVGSENAAKTHCDAGHPFDEANTIQRPGGRGRGCRACNNEAARRYRARRAAP